MESAIDLVDIVAYAAEHLVVSDHLAGLEAGDHELTGGAVLDDRIGQALAAIPESPERFEQLAVEPLDDGADARMVVEELNGSLNEEIRQELEHMGDLVREMLRRVLDAFARTDVETALLVVQDDKRVDTKYGSILRQLMTYMAADPRSIPLMLNILWAARAMERMGDRCENIAEYIFYLVHGRDIRHISLDDVRPESSADKPTQGADETVAARKAASLTHAA